MAPLGQVVVDFGDISLNVTNMQNDGSISVAGKKLVQSEWRDEPPALQWK